MFYAFYQEDSRNSGQKQFYFCMFFSLWQYKKYVAFVSLSCNHLSLLLWNPPKQASWVFWIDPEFFSFPFAFLLWIFWCQFKGFVCKFDWLCPYFDYFTWILHISFIFWNLLWFLSKLHVKADLLINGLAECFPILFNDLAMSMLAHSWMTRLPWVFSWIEVALHYFPYG